MVTIFGKSWDKQLLDQSAHCLGGIGLTVLLNIAVAAIYTVPYVVAFGIGREMIQHRTWRIGPGSLFDASFFPVGSLIWIAVLYFS